MACLYCSSWRIITEIPSSIPRLPIHPEPHQNPHHILRSARFPHVPATRAYARQEEKHEAAEGRTVRTMWRTPGVGVPGPLVADLQMAPIARDPMASTVSGSSIARSLARSPAFRRASEPVRWRKADCACPRGRFRTPRVLESRDGRTTELLVQRNGPRTVTGMGWPIYGEDDGT